MGLAVLSAAIGGYLMVIVNDADLPGSALAETGDSAMGLIVLGALVAFASGAVLASAPWWIRPTPRVRAALAAAAAAPFACILLLPLAPGIGGAEGAIADAALLLQATSALATGILALWGAFALVRTARGLAVALPAAAADGSRSSITLLVLKLGWVAVGYAGLLPPVCRAAGGLDGKPRRRPHRLGAGCDLRRRRDGPVHPPGPSSGSAVGPLELLGRGRSLRCAGRHRGPRVHRRAHPHPVPGG